MIGRGVRVSIPIQNGTCTGTTQSSVARIEVGGSLPTVDLLARLRGRRVEQLSIPVDRVSSGGGLDGCLDRLLIFGSFDEFAVDERCSGSHQRHEVGCVHRPPAVLC